MDVKPAFQEIRDRRLNRVGRSGRARLAGSLGSFGVALPHRSNASRLFVLLLATAFLAGPMLAQAAESCASCCCAAMAADMSGASHGSQRVDCSGSIGAGDCCEVEAASTPLPADRLVQKVEIQDRTSVLVPHSLRALDAGDASLGRSRPAARLAHRVSPLRRSVVLRL